MTKENISKALSEAADEQSESSQKGDSKASNLGKSAASKVDVEKGSDSETIESFVTKFFDKKLSNSEIENILLRVSSDLSSSESENLRNIILEGDPDLTKTVAFAEILMSRKGNAIDKMINLIERVVGGVGTNAISERNDVFQAWEDDLKSEHNLFEKFVNNIVRVKTERNGKPLHSKLRNNMIALAAIWLYRKPDKVNVSQLIDTLRYSALKTDGETGPTRDAQAFEFVVPMIRSTKGKRFSYFLDWVSETEKRLTARLKYLELQLNQKEIRLAEKISSLTNLVSDNKDLNASLKMKDLLIKEIEAENQSLLKRLSHREIHHEADSSSNKANFNATLTQLMESVELAKFGLEANKEHVVKYHVEMLEEKIKGALE